MSRPKRYWDTGDYKHKWAKIETAYEATQNPPSWSVCACHGRTLLWDSWDGLLKKKRR